MLKEALKDKVDTLEESVFKGYLGQVPAQVVELVQLVEMEIENYPDGFKKEWQQILNYLLGALESKDYLLVSDILKYELLTRL